MEKPTAAQPPSTRPHIIRLTALIIAICPWAAAAAELSDAEVAQRISEESMARYHGACPCPDSIMRNGRRCGNRSAWSRPGGELPICYPNEVSADQIREWRETNSVE